MLDPHERTSLFEALRPPAGYELDAAVGTSFTLDLEALLTAPIAFALFQEEDTPDGDREPVGLLEAIRRLAGRITLFCQAGQIAVPRRHRSVFAWLEGAVAPVPAPRPSHLFHPKLWVIRYREVGGQNRSMRLLCATRNLTFDASWDTLLRLESEPYANLRPRPVPGQATVSGFLNRLGKMTTIPLTEGRIDALRSLAEDLAVVPLLPPDGFDAVHLHVLGINDLTSDPLPRSRHRAAIVSPFLSARFLGTFLADHDVALLVSREESLDRIPAEVLSKIGRVAVLNSAIDLGTTEGPADGGPPGTAANEAADPAVPLSGLHAKLFVFAGHGEGQVVTGSANATEAAFNGNVEVVAELSAPSERPLEALLAPSSGETGIHELLVDYVPPEAPVVDAEQEQLELGLDEYRRKIAGLRYDVTITEADDQFLMTLTPATAIPRMDVDELSLTLWPVTLTEDQSAKPLTPGARQELAFNVSLEGITAFFAVRVIARKSAARAITSFTVCAVLEGAPEDRHGRLLAAMLRDPDRLIRFLLLLLSDEDSRADGLGPRGVEAWLGRWGRGSIDDLPLLELLIRAVDRYPDRLDHIDALLRDLADNEAEVLPPGFRDIWEPIWASRKGTAK